MVTEQMVGVRQLAAADRSALDALLQRDPIVNCMLMSRMWGRGVGVAETWGAFRGEQLVEVLHVAGNTVPAGGDPEAAAALAGQVRGDQRRTAAIVGGADEVAAVWQVLGPKWGPARDERMAQPLLVAQEPASVPLDPGVRLAEPDDAEALFGPSVAMFTEEVGASPLVGTNEAAYRARLMWLIRTGRLFCRYDDRGVAFKAEIAAVTAHACQVQGVWVRPDLRGRGLGSAAMAAVVPLALQLAPQVSLYVNDYNTAALIAYERAGFRRVGTMASVHF